LIAPCVDLWAFGVMVFEAVTGELPFAGFEQGRCPQLFEAAPRAGKLAAISPALDLLVARCLDRDPGKRPRSMAEVALALRCEEPELERVTQDLDSAQMAEHGVPAVRASRSHTKWWIAAGVAAVVLGVLAASFVPATSRAKPAASLTPPAPTATGGGAVTGDRAGSTGDRAGALTEPTVTTPAPVGKPAARVVRGRGAAAARGAHLVDGKPRGVTPAKLRLAKPTSILVRTRTIARAVRAERPGRSRSGSSAYAGEAEARSRRASDRETLD
jgi:hypothetical protein